MNTQVMVGLMGPLAHPHPKRVFVVGFGSGVSTRAAADVLGVEHVDLVEIERAVIRAAPLFSHVNRDVLQDPKVHLIEDDARSALQLAREPYDVIVSEPSNPWIAGVAALYTKQYFTIAKSRLNPDGIFAQWVQTYRVPLGVVAVVVSNLRSVFRHVEMWYANPADLIIIASDQPIHWDAARIAAQMAPSAASSNVFPDWLEVTQPSQLLGRFLLGDSGTAALARRAPFLHSDDRPTLEFVAARDLFAADHGNLFDSLLAIREAAHDSIPSLTGWSLGPGELAAAYAKSLPPENPRALADAQTALAAAPADPVRKGELGVVLFNRDQFRDALTHLMAAIKARPTDARYLLRAGQATLALGDVAGGRALLERSRANGGDSVTATSALAESETGQHEWAKAAADDIRALRAVNPTIAAPFPGALQNSVRALALEGPPEIAEPVLEEAVKSRPSWDLGWQGGAWANARWGGEHCARAAEMADEMSRFGWTEKEKLDLLRPCGRRR
jgi:hypothetical protein